MQKICAKLVAGTIVKVKDKLKGWEVKKKRFPVQTISGYFVLHKD